jgi:hypothetical protein
MIQISHTTIAEWSAEKARKTVHEDVLSFVTTAELVPLSSVVGQARALQALSHYSYQPGSGAAHWHSGGQYRDPHTVHHRVNARF